MVCAHANEMTQFINYDVDLEITVLTEEFEQDGVTVTLEWTEENSLYSYDVIVSPELDVMVINYFGRFSVRLKVPYNRLYNVSVAAMPPCQRNNMATFIGPSLYYTEYSE